MSISDFRKLWCDGSKAGVSAREGVGRSPPLLPGTRWPTPQCRADMRLPRTVMPLTAAVAEGLLRTEGTRERDSRGVVIWIGESEELRTWWWNQLGPGYAKQCFFWDFDLQTNFNFNIWNQTVITWSRWQEGGEMEESDAQAKTHLPSNSDIRESEPTNFKTNVLKLLYNINQRKAKIIGANTTSKCSALKRIVHQVSIF